MQENLTSATLSCKLPAAACTFLAGLPLAAGLRAGLAVGVRPAACCLGVLAGVRACTAGIRTSGSALVWYNLLWLLLCSTHVNSDLKLTLEPLLYVLLLPTVPLQCDNEMCWQVKTLLMHCICCSYMTLMRFMFTCEATSEPASDLGAHSVAENQVVQALYVGIATSLQHVLSRCHSTQLTVSNSQIPSRLSNSLAKSAQQQCLQLSSQFFVFLQICNYHLLHLTSALCAALCKPSDHI